MAEVILQELPSPRNKQLIFGDGASSFQEIHYIRERILLSIVVGRLGGEQPCLTKGLV